VDKVLQVRDVVGVKVTKLLIPENMKLISGEMTKDIGRIIRSKHQVLKGGRWRGGRWQRRGWGRGRA
jgi:hypothetical protein